MTDDPHAQARLLAERLHAEGHAAQAERLSTTLEAHHGVAHEAEHGLLFVLREACETFLTAIEAIDPATQAMIESLRLSVERRLGMPIDHSGSRTAPGS